jgi:ketosteroid isomerase-like protein
MTQVEKQIRELLGDFTRALHDKSARGVIVLLADDAQFFDLAPPLRLGAEATHNTARLEEWFRTWKSPIASESHELTVAASGGVAYAYALQHMTGIKTDGEKVDLWFRATACFRKESNRWRITHMHNSVPFAMDGSGRALLDLKPDANE